VAAGYANYSSATSFVVAVAVAGGGGGPAVELTWDMSPSGDAADAHFRVASALVRRCSLTPAGPCTCFQRLKLNYDELLSNVACFAFNCKLRTRSTLLAFNA